MEVFGSLSMLLLLRFLVLECRAMGLESRMVESFHEGGLMLVFFVLLHSV